MPLISVNKKIYELLKRLKRPGQTFGGVVQELLQKLGHYKEDKRD